MTRQDKLAYLINYLNVCDIEMQTLVKGTLKRDFFNLDKQSLLFFLRFGVILESLKIQRAQKLINKFTPINKHHNRYDKVNLFISNFCNLKPKCKICQISEFCDYYHKKNFRCES